MASLRFSEAEKLDILAATVLDHLHRNDDRDEDDNELRSLAESILARRQEGAPGYDLAAQADQACEVALGHGPDVGDFIDKVRLTITRDIL